MAYTATIFGGIMIGVMHYLFLKFSNYKSASLTDLKQIKETTLIPFCPSFTLRDPSPLSIIQTQKSLIFNQFHYL